jgi:hypothetical protein
MRISIRDLWRWFLFSGCVGVLIALALLVMATRHLVSPTVLLVFWPSSIAGIADPSDVLDKILVAAFEFGGNFLLYGIVGAVIRTGLRRGRSGRTHTTH